MPHSMAQRRIEITSLITRGYFDTEVNRLTHFSRSFIHQIRTQYAGDPATIFDPTRTRVAPRKLTGPVRERIRELTTENQRMSNEAVALVLSDSMIPSMSRARTRLDFRGRPPIRTFSLDETRVNIQFRSH
jgi:hypothetical protein